MLIVRLGFALNITTAYNVGSGFYESEGPACKYSNKVDEIKDPFERLEAIVYCENIFFVVGTRKDNTS